MRLRKVKNAQDIIEQNRDIILADPKQYKGKWNTVFNNNNPIEIEIGMGKGKFISTKAKENPNINYVGIEKFDSVIIRAIDSAKKETLQNLKLLHFDAKELHEVFANKEVQRIYLNFSDPWPKSRHAKRRLTHPSFLQVYKEILQSDGWMELKTDNQALFGYSVETFKEQGLKIIEINLNLHEHSSEGIITTEYEERFKSLGNAIYFAKVSF